MNPPIPEPMAAPINDNGPRPEALRYFIGVALLFTVAGLVYCDGTLTEHSVAADLIVYGLISIIWMGLLWFLWAGHNWARVTVLIWCAFALLGLFMMGDDSLLQKSFTIADTIFSLIFLWWLRSPAAVAFTKGRSSPPAST